MLLVIYCLLLWAPKVITMLRTNCSSILYGSLIDFSANTKCKLSVSYEESFLWSIEDRKCSSMSTKSKSCNYRLIITTKNIYDLEKYFQDQICWLLEKSEIFFQKIFWSSISLRIFWNWSSWLNTKYLNIHTST